MVHTVNFISLRGWRAITSLENAPVKSKTWWAGIGTLTHSRSYHVCVNVNNLPENQVYSFYNLFGACAVFVDCADSKIYQPLVQCLTPARALAHKWTKYNAKHESQFSLEPLRSHFPVTSHLPRYINKNEQHQIAWHNSAPCVFLFFVSLNKLAPFSGVSLFRFSTSICSPWHHEISAILSGWKLQEYLALSPEDCETN